MRRLIILALLAAACNSAAQGLDPSGSASSSQAIQAALSAAAPMAGGKGVVRLNPGLYRLTSGLSIPAGTTLCGATAGPHEPYNVMTAVRGATLVVDQADSPAVTLAGHGAALEDVLIHYAGQVTPASTAPIPFPPAVRALAPSKIRRITVTNAYEAVDIQVGRVHLTDSYLGGLYVGVTVDHAADHVILSNLVFSTFWDMAAGFSTLQPIDTWVRSNSTAMRVYRVDSFKASDVLVYSHRACFVASVSPDAAQVPRVGYGAISNLDCDMVRYGIALAGSNTPGWLVSNIQIGSQNPGVSAVKHLGGAPKLAISNMHMRGTWSGPAISAWPTGQLKLSNVLQ